MTQNMSKNSTKKKVIPSWEETRGQFWPLWTKIFVFTACPDYASNKVFSKIASFAINKEIGGNLKSDFKMDIVKKYLKKG
jgi:hypothetical protein